MAANGIYLGLFIELRDGWAASGLGLDVEELAARALDDVARVRHDAHELSEDVAATRRRVAQEVAHGATTMVAALPVFAVPSPATRAAIGELSRAAASAIMNEASDALRARSADIVGAVTDAVAGWVDEATELAPVLEGVEDDDDALRAAPHVREAWAHLLAISERLAGVRSSVNLLKRAGVPVQLPPRPPGRRPSSEVRETVRYLLALRPAPKFGDLGEDESDADEVDEILEDVDEDDDEPAA